MKVLILHRYFWPQAYPYAQMLKDIAEQISIKDEVSILTTDSGNLNEKDDRKKWSKANSITLQSLPLGAEKKASILKKGVNSLYFGLWILYKLLTSKADVVMVATTPPVIIAMLVRRASYIRKYKYIYHCQDIHPEAMLLGGNIKKGFVYKLLRKIDKKNINGAWKVITLSVDMKKTLEDRGCKTSHVKIINNFIFKNNGNLPAIKKNTTDKIQFLFAGSLGRLQNLALLMDSLVLLKHRNDIQFTFMGDGVMYKEMLLCIKNNNLTNVELLGQRSIKEAVEAMRIADVGIVSIANNITSVAYPSKTMMYLGNGLPVMALVDKHTELYKFINDKKVGIAFSPSSPEATAKSITNFVAKLKQKPINTLFVISTANTYFGKKAILHKFSEAFS